MMAPARRPETAPAKHSAVKKREKRLPRKEICQWNPKDQEYLHPERPLTYLIFFVPRRHHVHHARYEACLNGSQHESCSENAPIAPDLAHAGAHGTPTDGQHRDVPRWPNADDDEV